MAERQENERIRRGLRLLIDETPLAPEFNELVDGHLASPTTRWKQRSGWLVGLGTAAAVLIVALVPLLLSSDNPGGSPVIPSGDGPVLTAPEDESTTSTPDVSTTLPEGSVQTTGSGAVSPLNSAFVTLEEADSEVWDEMVVQEYVAVCMRQEGFEYTPYVEEPTDERSDWERPVFPVGGESGVSQVEAVDPNQAYLDSLSDSERRAYMEALTGQDPDVVIEEGSPEGDSDIDATGGSGCDGQARRRYEAELESARESEEGNAVLFAQLDEAVNQMIGELESDETVVAALTDYSGCLADAGFPVQYPSSAFDTVYWMPQELHWYLAEQGADLLDAVSSNPEANPVDLVGAERVEELSQLEADAREAHTTCVQPLEDAVRAFEIEYASSDPILSQYLSAG